MYGRPFDPAPLAEPLMDAADVARLLKLVRRDGALNVKRVYELPIRKTRVGRSVRYRRTDVELYLAVEQVA